jgi:hypothetical protein
MTEVFVAIAAGLFIAVAPWFVVLGVVAGIVCIFAAARYPHVGIIIVMILEYEVLPSQFQPKISVGPGGLTPVDLLIMFLFAVIAVRSIVSRVNLLDSFGPYLWPLLYLFGAITISIIYVIFFQHNALFLTEGRHFIYWLVMPFLLMAIDTPRRFSFFFRALLAIGFVIALYVAIQSFFGVRLMTGVRVEALDPTRHGDITRSIAGGGTYIYLLLLFYAINEFISKRMHPALAALVCIVVLSALAAGFGRGIWIASMAGLVVSAYLYRGVAGVAKVGMAAGLFAISAMIAIWSIYPDFVEAVIDRALSVRSEISAGASFGYRIHENEDALRAIKQKPVLGIGIGGTYRDSYPVDGINVGLAHYIHNSYLYFPLKFGIWATFIPFVFMASMLMVVKTALRNRLDDEKRSMLGSLTGVFLVICIVSYTQPEWVGGEEAMALGAIMAMAWILNRLAMDARSNVAATRTL